MKSASDKMFKLGLMLNVLDWFTFNVVIFAMSFLIRPLVSGNLGLPNFNLLIANIAYVIALQVFPISLQSRHSIPADVLSNTSRTSVLFIILYISFISILYNESGHGEIPGVSHSLAIVIFLFIVTSVERFVLRHYLMNRRGEGRDSVKAVIIGVGSMMQSVADVMTNPFNGYRLLGFFSMKDTDSLADIYNGVEVRRLGGKTDIMAYLENNDVDEVYIGMLPELENELKPLLQFCNSRMIRTYYIPVMAYKEFRKARVIEFGDVFVMSRRREPLRDIKCRICKRSFDVLVSLLFICTLFPVILVIVAIVSKITMRGSIFFRQKRTGYDGKDFWCYKFRSMKVNKDADRVQAVKNDPRVTKWGLFMRHTNIDELPQFINVLKGDMSIVGPRPHMLMHTEYYSNLINEYMIRHYVKPGITGWAQTQGERGETRTVEDMRRRVEKDIWYIEHWSFWLDIQIIYKTILDAFHGDAKAY